MHYKVASGHREFFFYFFQPFQLLPPNCLPESPDSIDSESVFDIKLNQILKLDLKALFLDVHRL